MDRASRCVACIYCISVAFQQNMAEKMEVVAGTICVLGLSGAIILAHLPAYLTGNVPIV